MSSLSDKYAFRAELVTRLETDLVGPSAEDEVLTEDPLDRYIVGVLWPSSIANQQETPEEPIPAETSDPGAQEDTPVSQTRMKYPSSVGMTFSLDTRLATDVTVQAVAARYLPLESGSETPDGQRSRSRRASDRTWVRDSPIIPCIDIDSAATGPSRHDLADGLQLYALVRPIVEYTATITVVLVNTHEDSIKGGRDARCWFQVGLQAESVASAIVDRNKPRQIGHDDDLDSAALLYRNAHTFASGHGCAATWESETQSSVAHVRTTFVPRVDLARAKAGAVEGADLRMSFLATAPDERLVPNLRTVVIEYRRWIELQHVSAADDATISADLQPVAAHHLDEAEKAAKRIDAGIDLISRDAKSMQAFRLMNRAMQVQRARQDWVRSGSSGPVGEGLEQVWRPFQIAFVLLNLPGISDPKHPDRDVADLLWFPTGGGKTEAYLGLIAYTIIRRRLVDKNASGVAVIMRYTLRLLTIQQFERAAMLMCSLERIRQSEQLGTRPFSIGLWVGAGATPNSVEDARKALGRLGRGHDVEEGNPMQIVRCPWCGEVLGPDNYKIVRAPEPHLEIACGQLACDFGRGLPVHLVDDDVYRARPELIIGTVDKFARMAWSDKVASLFGRDGTSNRPELIIQDELHLISGPLGSMVGLYEAAVDAACSIDTADPFTERLGRPKIVASTATIRRASEQVRAVFERSAAQFPPPGLDPDRSFFAEPAPPDELGTRQYVGVMAPGTSQQTLMVRVYASLLQNAKELPGLDATRDPYWTLVGYFSSLRVLGSAYLQVQDDVRTRLAVLAGRTNSDARPIVPPSELTSRVSSTDIPERLKSLETEYPNPNADDVVLATNMISVGVDVDRLGLMAVMGQPQSSAEYIQATSRVGRRHPGLVVTILNSARSRDRSHYENFLQFHNTIYRSVEATSATPFAARARDRGLHGVLTSIVRLLFADLAPDSTAHLVDGQPEKLQRAAELIVARAKACSDEAVQTGDQLDELIRVWTEAAEARVGMRYANKHNPEAALLIDPSDALVNPDVDYSQTETPWPTLQSLRDVDAESHLYLIPMGKS